MEEPKVEETTEKKTKRKEDPNDHELFSEEWDRIVGEIWREEVANNPEYRKHRAS